MGSNIGKQKLIVIRVTEDEKKALEKKASEFHLNVSRYLIMIGLRGRVG